MTSVEAVCVWIAIACYAAGTISVFSGLVFSRGAMVTRAVYISLVGVLAQSVAIAARWRASGHFPYIEDYENVLVGTLVMVIAYLAISKLRQGLAVSGALVLPVVLLTMGYGLTQVSAPSPVTPPYQSAWLVIHVTFAWVTYALYAAVAGLAIVFLVRQRAERLGRETMGIPSWVPPSSEIDDLSLKLVALGFLNNAVMIASGAIWAYRLWGSYWSWDPVETWSLLTWLAYALYMHARLTLGWKGKRLAWLALFALFGVLMTFWGVQLVPSSYHLFRNIGAPMMDSSRP